MKRKPRFKIPSKYVLMGLTLLCAILVYASFTMNLSGGPLNTAAGYVFIPMQRGINHVGLWISDKTDNLKDLKDVMEENAKLKAQVDELTLQNNELAQNQKDLTRLRELYDLDREYAQYNKILAEVIAKDPGNWYHTFTINKGSDDGRAVFLVCSIC